MLILSGNLGNLDYDSSDSEKGEISKKAAENESRDGDRQRGRENDKGKNDYGKLRIECQISKFQCQNFFWFHSNLLKNFFFCIFSICF